MEAQHTKHVTYKLASHFVWCPKYRNRILSGKIATFQVWGAVFWSRSS